MRKELLLADLIALCGSARPTGLDMPARLVIDSRQATPGSIFCALKGEHTDGHAFVADAFARGAIAALVSQPVALPDTPLLIRVPDVLQALQRAATHWRQQFDIPVIGVTGSVGKTTTKEVIAQVLAQRFEVLCSPCSYNNELGLPLTLLQLHSEHTAAVLEMGMYTRGDIHALTEIARPTMGVVTNVEAVHLERAKTLENIALTKQELVEALPTAEAGGIAVLNYDDQHVRAMAQATDAQVLFYGLSPEADLWADDLQSLGLAGIQARLHYQDEATIVRAPLLGLHNVQTVLRAAAVGLLMGLSWDELSAGLWNLNNAPRLTTVRSNQGALILDDTYNASPPAVLAALDLLNELQGRKIAVLGDMLELGKYEAAGHQQVGQRAAEVAEQLVLVGQLAKHYIAGARAQGMAQEHLYVAADNADAVRYLQSLLGPEDIVLIKGSRGMQMETIVAALTQR